MKTHQQLHHGFRRKAFKPLLSAVAMAWLLLAGLAGCATVGREFPVAEVSRIQVGVTTQNQVREMFGEPWRTGVEDGDRTWTYGKYRYTLLGAPSTTDLVIRFDAQHRVKKYSFNTTETGQ